MSEIKELLSQAENKGLQTADYVSKHRTVIIIFVACIAILAAVLQTQSYLNPTRNEDKYNELKSSISVKKIDQETLEKLEKTQEDSNSTVDSNFVPDRKNPFVE